MASEPVKTKQAAIRRQECKQPKKGRRNDKNKTRQKRKKQGKERRHFEFGIRPLPLSLDRSFEVPNTEGLTIDMVSSEGSPISNGFVRGVDGVSRLRLPRRQIKEYVGKSRHPQF